MEYEKMESSALEERKLALAEEIEKDDADLDAIEEEVRAINSELETRENAEQKRKALRDQVANGQGEVVEEFKEERKMEDKEIRNSKAYIDAYAEYVKTGDDKECRALLTENANSGTVPVPEFVLDEVKRAWDEHPLMRYVRKTYMKGNLKIGFEKSASSATQHEEGVAVAEENLQLGIVNIIPKSLKKWISVSDEVLDMRGEGFLRYVYDEIAHKITELGANLILASIRTALTDVTGTLPEVQNITISELSLDSVAQAIALLSDEASNPVIVMSKPMWAQFKALQYSANYAVDPFEGLPIVFMSAGGTNGFIVGDFNYGAIANFPDGEEIKFNFDDKTLATSDLVRIIGRQYGGLGVVAPDAFVTVQIQGASGN